KITNFQKSSISGVIENNNTKRKKENLFYDVHYFLYSLLLYLKKHNAISYELQIFFDEIIPQKFRSIKDDKFIGLDEDFYGKEVDIVFTPMIILTKNNFFLEFIKKNTMKSSNSKKLRKPESVKSYGIKEKSIDYSISSSISHNTDSPLLLAQEQVKRKSKDNSVKYKEGFMTRKNFSKKTSKKNQKSIKGTRALRLAKNLEEDKKDSEVFRYSETGLTITEAQMPSDSSYNEEKVSEV
ncbi:MAG: hypothetical protein GTN36_01370, partial [Candidatus Aenigmarchaeota archaeon]|nr:hypothetical protein [Candidatus Aenigmarchaeota archaeon]